MQKKKRNVIFGSVKIMLAVTFLAALSIVCGKYLAIRGGDVMRFSFENLPILLAGIAFGPVAGLVTGILADLLGCLMVGYTINPLVTLGAAVIGLLGGLLFRLCKKWPLLLKTGVAVFGAHLIGSVVIKTFGLAQFYAMPFMILMLWRLLNYTIISALEITLLYLLGRNAAIARSLRAFSRDSSLL